MTHEAAAGLFCLKDQYDEGVVFDDPTRKELWKMRTYMEFDIAYNKAKIPACSKTEFGLKVAEYVMLHDPDGNVIEVNVEKKSGKLYFKDGWYRLKYYYKKWQITYF